MKHFIETNTGKLRGFLDDGSQDFLITSGMRPASDAEVSAIQNPQDLADSRKRGARDAALTRTDWMVTRNAEEIAAGREPSLSAERFSELLAYRQALRDLTSRPEWPNVTIPYWA